MAEQPPWRQGYDAVERQVGPRLEAVVRSEQFAVALGLAARVQRALQQQAGRTTRRVLHQLNLPAGTDVSRILNELGQLRRQVRELSSELDSARAELAASDGPATAAPKARRSATATKRAGRSATATKRAGRSATAAKKGGSRGTDPGAG